MFLVGSQIFRNSGGVGFCGVEAISKILGDLASMGNLNNPEGEAIPRDAIICPFQITKFVE